ncbi:MAG: amidohydrolase family protein [Planctomycetales bacterium]|nr:amidohydrolase family protein [Planctomycetales bacterium]
MTTIAGRRFDTGESVRVSVERGVITAIEPQADATDWLGPGLVDLQINGYGGQEFNDLALTPEQVASVSTAMDRDGLTAYLPTATTHSFEMLRHTMSVLAEARRTIPEVAARAPGFHLEGPYLSPQDGPRGAHPLEHIRPPDWDEFQRLQEAAEGGIRILTVSPEYDNAPEFIRRVVDSGVVVSIGHTAATGEQIQAAADSGATSSTHLGNGAHGMLRRHPNYLWDQLADDRLVANLIADGHHLPDAVLKTFVRAKSPARCVLVSDITGLGGMPPGRYESTSIGDVEVLEDGRLVVAGQRQFLAGAALPLRRGVPQLMRAAGLSLAEALPLATTQPARLASLPAGDLRIGARADLITFRLPADDDNAPMLEITSTMLAGNLVYTA